MVRQLGERDKGEKYVNKIGLLHSIVKWIIIRSRVRRSLSLVPNTLRVSLISDKEYY